MRRLTLSEAFARKSLAKPLEPIWRIHSKQQVLGCASLAAPQLASMYFQPPLKNDVDVGTRTRTAGATKDPKFKGIVHQFPSINVFSVRAFAAVASDKSVSEQFGQNHRNDQRLRELAKLSVR